jgi:hypothetical protein
MELPFRPARKIEGTGQLALFSGPLRDFELHQLNQLGSLGSKAHPKNLPSLDFRVFMLSQVTFPLCMP